MSMRVCDVDNLADAGDKETMTGFKVTIAVADLVPSATLVAFTAIACRPLTLAGAV